MNLKEVIIDYKQIKGPGIGFCGTETLTKDELNLIMDLEDEKAR